MQRHHLAGGREKALGGVVHLLEVMQALGVEIEELEGHAHAVAGMQFAQDSGCAPRP